MPLMPMPPIPTKCTRRVRPSQAITPLRLPTPASAITRSTMRAAASGRASVRIAAAIASQPSRGRPAAPATLAASDSPASDRRSSSTTAAPASDQHLRVLALVVVGRAGKRNEHGRPSRRRQLGQRRRAGPADRPGRRAVISPATRSRNGSARAATPARSYAVADVSPDRARRSGGRSRRPASVRASCGAAATMATLIACAPWEPPRTSTLARRFEVRTSQFERLRRTPPAPDYPRQSPSSRKTAASPRRSRPPRARTRASSRFVRPGTAFCSSTIVGMPPQRRQRARPDPSCSRRRRSRRPDGGARGAATRRADRQRQERRAAQPGAERLALEARAANQIQLEPFARNHPRFESPRRARKRHRAAGTRRAISRATAIPGYRWPPVPPPAITTASPVTSATSRFTHAVRPVTLAPRSPRPPSPTPAARCSAGCPSRPG